MTQIAPEIIDLGVPGGDNVSGEPRLPARTRRQLTAAALALVCLLALGASAVRTPGLGDPLWTGTVGLTGFDLGANNLYAAQPGGGAMVARDLRTGREQWRIDLAGLPDVTADLGDGTTAVVTRQLRPYEESQGRPDYTVTFVRESTGEQVARTTGYYYLPSVGGLPLVMFTDRPRDAAGCGALETSCLNLAGWDLNKAVRTWWLELPPDYSAFTSVTDDHVDGLADLAPDGTVRLRDLASGTVLGTTMLPRRLVTEGRMTLTHEALLTLWHGQETIEITAYVRPTLDRAWSVTLPAHVIADEAYFGPSLSGCGRDACLDLDGTDRVIDVSTGSIKASVELQLVDRLGNGVFLATEANQEGPSGFSGYVLDPSGRTIAQLAVTGRVPWDDNGGRAMLTQTGPERTGFVTIDDRGRQHNLGSVSGTDLTCRAHGQFLACNDLADRVRVWRLPNDARTTD